LGEPRVLIIPMMLPLQTIVGISLSSHSLVAQLVERMTVNHLVVGSSPAWGASGLVAELADAHGSSPCENFHGGSSPS
jgi:hypothetical protein